MKNIIAFRNVWNDLVVCNPFPAAASPKDELMLAWLRQLCLTSTLVIMLATAGLAIAKPASQMTGVPVIVYHQIVTDGTAPDATVISLTAFSEQMHYLSEQGYHPISMTDLVAYMRHRKRLPTKPIVLTFDDGWLNVLNAVPVLERYQFKASFWVITGKRGIGWPYMEWSDIRGLSRNPRFEVESHTVSHPWDPADNLVTWVQGQNPGKGAETARLEIDQSRRELQLQLRKPVRYLAWPCGWFNDTLVTMAQRAGYTALMTIIPGLNKPDDNVLLVKRTMIDGRCGMAEFAATVQDGMDRYCQSPPAEDPVAYRTRR